MSIKSEIARAQNLAISRLSTLRDEARVRLHLLSLDARQRWDELETKITELESHANRDGEKTAETLAENARELGRAVSEFMVSSMSSSPGLLTGVRTIMSSDVRVCHPRDTLNEVARSMWERDCGSLPVEENGKVIGHITDRDVCMAGYTQGKALSEIPVESAMSKRVYCCAPDDSIGDALALMAEHRIRRLPVREANGRLCGIVTLADIARWAPSASSRSVDAAVLELLSSLAKPASEPLHAAAE